MKNRLVVLALGLCLATPCLSETFTTEKPSPLKLAAPGKEDDVRVRFRGEAQISGRFFVGWELIAKGRSHLHVQFFPDQASAGILPHVAGDGPVEELLFSNFEAAVSILLDAATAQKILAKELRTAQGEATITVREYSMEVACDHRWYVARLISASRKERVAVDASDYKKTGC